MSIIKENGFKISILSFAFLASLIVFFVSNDIAKEKSAELEIIHELNWMIPLGQYEYIEPFQNKQSLLLIRENNHYGGINKDGGIVIPCIYDHISVDAHESLICASIQSKFGYLDESGKIAIPFIYDEAFDFCGEFALVSLDGRCQVINTSGKVIYENPESYMMYPTEKEGLFSFWKGKSLYEEWSAEEKSCKGLVDITSDTILIKPDKYQDAFRYSEGFWLTAMYPTKSMIIPTYLLDGEWVEAFTDKTFHLAGPFSEGLAAVAIFEKNTDTVQNRTIGEWGYMDSEGTMLESDLFLGSGSSFKEGLAGIYDEQRLVFINTSGEEVFEIKRHGNFMFSKEVFQEGFAPIATKSSSIGPYGRIGFRRIKGMSWGYVDKKGDFVVPPIFQDAFPVTGGMAVVQYAGNYGVIYLK